MIQARAALLLAALIPAPPALKSGDVTYQGFVNEPLGQARLAIDANGHLVVSGIGSSGQDGVAVTFGVFPAQPNPFEWELDLPDAASAPDGAYVELTTIGIVDALPDQVLQVYRIEDLGGLWGLKIDTTPLMSGSLSLSATDEDVVYGSGSSPPSAPSTTLATFATGALRVNPVFAGDVAVFASLRFDQPSPFAFPQTGASAETTEISWIAVGGPKIAGVGLRFELRAAGLDPLVIEDEDTIPDCVDPFLAGAYCTAKTSSAGCVASIWPDAELGCTPTSGAADFSARALGVQGQKPGLLFFGLNGAAALPFSGGVLCLQPPLARGPVALSGGSGPLACDGALQQIVNDGGIWDPGPGNTTWIQAWYRDPAGGAGTLGTALSNALALDFQ